MKRSIIAMHVLLFISGNEGPSSIHAAFTKVNKQVFSSRETNVANRRIKIQAANSIYKKSSLESGAPPARRSIKNRSQRNLMIQPIEFTLSTFDPASITVASTSDQILEAEVFADLAHLILDVATIYAPDTLILRAFLLLGRVLSILSDYIPDKAITVDELFFQSSMLVLASYNFITMFIPHIISARQKTSFQDRRIYSSIFRSVGFTWLQFKFLIANGSFEWIDIQANSTLIETKENLLITYRGPISKIPQDDQEQMLEQDQKVYGKKRKGRHSHQIIGDLSSTKQIVDSYGLYHRFDHKQLFQHSRDPQILMTESDRVSLLRINTEQLLHSAKVDPRIDSPTKKLLLNAVLSLYERETRV